MQYAIMLMIMGIVLEALSYAFEGSPLKDFLSGLFLSFISSKNVGWFICYRQDIKKKIKVFKKPDRSGFCTLIPNYIQDYFDDADNKSKDT